MEKKEVSKKEKTPRQKGYKKSIKVKAKAEKFDEVTTTFKIKKIKTPAIPEFKSKSEIDIRYPLIKPYVNVHVYYDSKKKQVRYEVEEPELNDKEKKLLRILESGLEELISLSFLAIKTEEAVIEYLEKNIKILLNELNISVNKNTFLKLMYYIYRNFVGLNEIEPMMRDYYIEDIECNGLNSPIYIVHRKYRNLRTNIIFRDMKYLTSFVEKMAQKAGKYISYASPTLDGRLPDGSRVNATYTQEITTKGPTFTIRKFTAEPWSPVKLMEFRTVSPELLAYLWLLIEHECNIMVIGGTGTGKCVVGDTPIYLANGKVKKIKNLIEEKFSKGQVVKNDDGWEILEGDGTKILCMNQDNLKIEKAKISKFWRHKASKKLYRVLTRSGREVITTPEHPFFTLNEGEIVKIRADRLNEDERIAVPRYMPFNKTKKKKLNLIKYIVNEKEIFVPNICNEVEDLFRLLIKKYNLNTKKELAKKLGYKYGTFKCWSCENAIPLNVYNRLIKLTGRKLKNDLVLKSRTGGFNIKLPNISKDLFRFLALVIADGHLNRTNVELHNSNKDLLNEFISLGKKLFGKNSRIEDYGYRVAKVRINSIVVAKLLNKVFEIPYGKKSSKVIIPKLLFEQNNDCISEFISGIFDCEGYVEKTGLEIGMNSKRFLDELSTLLLRFGVVPRTRKRRIIISGFNNIKLFKDNLNLRHNIKSAKLSSWLNRGRSRLISNVDLIPNCSNTLKNLRANLGLSQKQFSENVGVSRRLVGMWENGFRNPSIMTFNNVADFVGDFDNNIYKIAKSDLFWDEVVKIEELTNHGEEYVYDLTVNEHHNFLAGNIPIVVHNTSMLNCLAFFIPPAARIVSIEDTRELNLLHENWLPSVSRAGLGLGTKVGYGEVSLFDLLKASFRQRPDYVIVGEVRGREASVLFQGMSSGHPSFGTMHAEDVETMVRRLETPPIELSPSLVQSLDAVCVMTHAKVGGKDVRRVREVAEIVGMGGQVGKVQTNVPFLWDPRTDRFYFKLQSTVLSKIVTKSGLSLPQLIQELRIRARLLMALYKNNIVGYKEVYDIIHGYYRSPKEVLAKFNIS